MVCTDLSNYSSNNYFHGRNLFTRLLWFVVSSFFFQSNFPFPVFIKVRLLRLFGSEIGIGVVLKTNINIKQPWFLKIGDNCWIGEGVWIDNLVLVEIGNNCCLSQGSFLLTGNHNYKSVNFDLFTASIVLQDGVWLGAKSLVGPGVVCGSHSVLTAGSCAFRDLKPYSIYQGNPALFKKKREFRSDQTFFYKLS